MFWWRSLLWRYLGLLLWLPVFEIGVLEDLGGHIQPVYYWFEPRWTSWLRTAILGYRRAATPHLTFFRGLYAPIEERWGRPVLRVREEDLTLLGKAVVGGARFGGCASGHYLPEEGEVYDHTIEVFQHRKSGCFVVFITLSSPYECGDEKEVEVFWRLEKILRKYDLRRDFQPSATLADRLARI